MVALHFGKEPIAMIPNDYRQVQSALDQGHGLMTANPKSPARLAILKMAQRIIGDQPSNKLLTGEPITGERRGVLRRLFQRTKNTIEVSHRI
jgi:Flp pilus assembly CpaE family ATPase